MYAIIRTGGKQYRVAESDVLKIEKLPGAAGETVAFGEVLMVGAGAEARVGAPLVEGARVTAEILEQARGPKIIVFKKQRRQNHRRKRGHRQDLTVVRITAIEAKAKAAAKATTPKAVKPKADDTAAKASTKKAAASADDKAAAKAKKATRPKSPEKPKSADKTPAGKTEESS